MNPVVHFEMPAEDMKRMTDFYMEVFGWQMNYLGPKMGDYVTVMTMETDENNRPKNVGGINGGFFPKMKDAQHPSVVIAVDNIKEYMRKVTDAGGKIIGGQTPGVPDDIPGVGKYISIRDTEGNRVGILQSVEGMEKSDK